MPGPTIQWTPIDTTEVISEIREEGRYRLASPSAVTGTPSLAMQAAGQSCTVKVYIGGVYRSDALLTVPSTAPVAISNAVGQPLTGQEMFDMVIEVGNLGFGSVILTTDEPNGSPSAPFTTVAERTAWATANLASLLPGRTTAWGPGNQEYRFVGPAADVWKNLAAPTAQKKIPSPLLVGSQQAGVSMAYGFSERFRSSLTKAAVGFDVCWMNGGSSNASLAKTAWSIAANLTGTAVQASPASLQINGVDISNATIPLSTTGEVSNLLISDFVNVPIPAGSIIEVRSNVAAGAGHTYNSLTRGSDSYTAPATDVYACEVGAVGPTGDCITGNPSVAFSTSVVLGVCFVRFYYEDGSISVLNTGDSITKGEAGFSGQIEQGNISPLNIASQLYPAISPIVFGRGTLGSAVFHKNAMLLIPVLKPSIVLIPAWSPNDGLGSMNTSINRALQVAKVAQDNGCIAALATPIPWSYTGSNVTTWQAGVARVRSICASNPAILLVDLCAALEDPANPGFMRAEYFGTATDGQEKHPNPLGKIAEANEIVRAISTIA